jgi:hypothetical protein
MYAYASTRLLMMGVLKTCRSAQVLDMLLTQRTLSSTTDRCHGARWMLGTGL